MRATVVTLLAVVLLAQLAAMIVPWNEVDGGIEWDDGMHIWGRNVHDASDWVFELEGDDDALLYWTIAFIAFAVGILFTGIALITAIADLRGVTLGMAYPAVLLSGAGIGGFIFSLVTDPGEILPKAGLFVAGGQWVVLLVATIMGGWIGRSRRAVQEEEPEEDPFSEPAPHIQEPFLDEGHVEGDEAHI